MVSCSSLTPIERPEVEACVMDYPAGEAICGFDKQRKIFRVPLSQLDHSTLMRPGEWEKLQNYLDIIKEEKKSCD